MKLLVKTLGLIAAGSLISACAMDTNDESANQAQPEETESSAEPTEEATEPTEKTTEEEEQETYSEEVIEGSYAVVGHTVNLDGQNMPVRGFSFNRTDKEEPREIRLMEALIESDVSIQKIFTKLQEVRIVEETEAELIFTDDEQFTSLASAEQQNLTGMIEEVSHFFGISELRFYIGDEPGIMYGQTGELDGMTIEAAENRGYYLPTGEAADSNETIFVSGSALEKNMKDENGELFDFAATVEEMTSSKEDASAYESAIPETIEIQDIQIEGEEAEVVFEMDVDQPDREQMVEQFETVLQLTALDVGLTSLHIIDESDLTKKTYTFDRPSVDEQQDQPEENGAADGEKADYQNARFGFTITYPANWNEGEEADNGDGLVLHDTENDEVDIRVFGRHQQEEFTPDTDEYEAVTIADGQEAYFKETTEGDRYTFEVFKTNDEIEYFIMGDVTADFYEENMAVINEMIQSFKTAE